MTAPELSTIWPDNRAVWPNTIAEIKNMAVTPNGLKRMSVGSIRPALLVVTFANITAEFFVPFDLARVQHLAYLRLRFFFNHLNLRTCLRTQLSNLMTAFFKDQID